MHHASWTLTPARNSWLSRGGNLNRKHIWNALSPETSSHQESISKENESSTSTYYSFDSGNSWNIWTTESEHPVAAEWRCVSLCKFSMHLFRRLRFFTVRPLQVYIRVEPKHWMQPSLDPPTSLVLSLMPQEHHWPHDKGREMTKTILHNCNHQATLIRQHSIF